MKDWRDCKKLMATAKKKPIILRGKTYYGTTYNFDICRKCPIEKCKGKILIAAEQRAMGAISKLQRGAR